MKTTIVLAVLLAATAAFAQSSGGPGAPGATIHDYKLAPHQRTTHHPAMTGGGSHGYNRSNHHTGTASH
jgi:hypothetical protein